MLLLSLLSCSLVADRLNQPADPGDPTEILFEVPKGTTARGLGPLLEAADVVEDGGDFALYARLTKQGACLKAGKHRLRRDMAPGEILSVVCGAPVPDDAPFTVVEGWRARDIDAALAEKGLIQAGAYLALSSQPSQFHASFPLPEGSLEGFLYPETYMITPDRFDPAMLIQRQIDLFDERFGKPYADKWATRGLGPVVIMASLLEREEPKPDNRPMVAGILWKRLDNAWNLGVDATSRYNLAVWNDRVSFLKQLRDPNDPYNTRLRPGLPPTAIGNPALPSLAAAVEPTDSPYWYYLHDGEQNLHPSKNVTEHEAARRRYNVY